VAAGRATRGAERPRARRVRRVGGSARPPARPPAPPGLAAPGRGGVRLSRAGVAAPDCRGSPGRRKGTRTTARCRACSRTCTCCRRAPERPLRECKEGQGDPRRPAAENSRRGGAAREEGEYSRVSGREKSRRRGGGSVARTGGGSVARTGTSDARGAPRGSRQARIEAESRAAPGGALRPSSDAARPAPQQRAGRGAGGRAGG
jgi:hypothetical protein